VAPVCQLQRDDVINQRKDELGVSLENNDEYEQYRRKLLQGKVLLLVLGAQPVSKLDV
jgi:hypothetical protein